ncbi:MAG: HAMP domain-containing histidine kinase [Microbacteriaceae bacterium]|nr:HAMP domain-containing histidine kinase [Microbacteriaceae bacterium]
MIFRRALIRLTLTYTIVQLVLFGAFALGVYSYVTGTFDFDAAIEDGESSLDVDQAFANLRTGLIAGYALLVLFLPVSSYVMARGALAPVQRSYELQQHFVDAASHEFRTPLSIVQGELELALSRSRTPTEYRMAMATALAATEGLGQLTGDLLMLTRGNSHELEESFVAVSLNDLARMIVDSHATDAVRLSLIDDDPVAVHGSPELLRRAISNVVDNALKFSNREGTVEVSVSGAGKFAELTVRDHGVGMTEAESARAFDRFWRAQTSRTTPGFGLGLPLVRQIVMAHHGQVSVESAMGVGTTVTLVFPVMQR